jgi:predicted MFS family arabinose efflux permease
MLAFDQPAALLPTGTLAHEHVQLVGLANSSVQLWSDPHLRGRIMGLYMVVFTGGTPIGAPIIGAITDHLGARTGMTVCGAVPALAAAVLVLRHVRAARPRPRLSTRDIGQPRNTG